MKLLPKVFVFLTLLKSVLGENWVHWIAQNINLIYFTKTRHLLEDLIPMIYVFQTKGFDLTFKSKRLSGMHLKILKFGDTCFIEDLSTNGTYIQNNKVKLALLQIYRLEKEINKKLKMEKLFIYFINPKSRLKKSLALFLKLEIH